MDIFTVDENVLEYSDQVCVPLNTFIPASGFIHVNGVH